MNRSGMNKCVTYIINMGIRVTISGVNELLCVPAKIKHNEITYKSSQLYGKPWLPLVLPQAQQYAN